MIRTAAIILCAALLAGGACTPSEAAPRARNRAECAIVGNMAFVAGVLAKNGWTQADALKIYRDLYGDIYGERPADAPELARLAIAAAYANRQRNPKEEPIVFANAVALGCHVLGGDLDSLLGTGT